MLPRGSAWSCRTSANPIRSPCRATSPTCYTQRSRPVRALPGALCTSSSSTSSSPPQAPRHKQGCSCQPATWMSHGCSAAGGPLRLLVRSRTCAAVRPSRQRVAAAASRSERSPPPPSAAAGPSAPLAQQQQQQPLPLGSCPRCQGEGRVPCKACEGSGRLKRGGYQKRNRVDLSRAVGSKWTALQPTLGWRHFQVVQLRRTSLPGKAGCFLLLQANCDTSAQIWVNACTLRLRSCWAAGWLPMSEIADAEGLMAGQGQLCQTCQGTGWRPCDQCMGSAKVQMVVVR